MIYWEEKGVKSIFESLRQKNTFTPSKTTLVYWKQAGIWRIWRSGQEASNVSYRNLQQQKPRSPTSFYYSKFIIEKLQPARKSHEVGKGIKVDVFFYYFIEQLETWLSCVPSNKSCQKNFFKESSCKNI